MRRFLTIAALTATLAATATIPPSRDFKVDRIDPPYWYCGLNNPSLQLMVSGFDLKTADFSVNYPGVTVDSIVRLDGSDNYLLIYLNVKDAKPGTMELRFKQAPIEMLVPYELKQREKPGTERRGFTNADVLYMLMPDRFANGDTSNDQLPGMRQYKCDRSQPSLRHGGDLEGIRRHLDYFNDLGVTALWLTPVLENDSPDGHAFSTYHGYATTDYYRVDPRFGTNDEYRRLTDEAHARGLKVVMDMIFNHCGFEHPWVADRPATDWFNTDRWLDQRSDKRRADTRGTDYLQTSYKLTPVLDPYASEIDLRETVEGWFVPTMPDLNQRNPHVMTYLIQNSVWWIETVGIDGIRMDTYPYAYADAMARWMKALDTEYPNFNVVGETWVEQPAYTATWQKGSPNAPAESYLKTVMDFSFHEKVDSARTEVTDGWWRGFNRLYNSLAFDYLYPDPDNVMAFVDNHDTDRFLRDTKDDKALKQALALLLTIRRIPQLYYGTEILMNGTKQRTDGDVRRDFPGGFPGDERDCFTADGRNAAEQDMFQWLSRVLHWRQNNPAIIGGKMTQFIPVDGVYVIARRGGGRTVLTVVNGTNEQKPLHVARYAEVIAGRNSARDIPTGTTVDLSRDVTLPPRATLILEL